MAVDQTIQYLAAVLAFVGILLTIMIGAACGLLLTRDSSREEGEKVTAIREIFFVSKRNKKTGPCGLAKQIPGVDASQINQAPTTV